MVVASIVSRAVGVYIPGTDAYAGYFMAASGFLALGPTLRHGGHIRVELFLQQLRSDRRLLWERVCGLIGFAVAGFLAWYSVRLAWQSHLFNDVSQGADATPLWIPQIGMALGCITLAIALAEIVLAPRLGNQHTAEDNNASIVD